MGLLSKIFRASNYYFANDRYASVEVNKIPHWPAMRKKIKFLTVDGWGNMLILVEKSTKNLFYGDFSRYSRKSLFFVRDWYNCCDR
jgi:hypothetical protein